MAFWRATLAVFAATLLFGCTPQTNWEGEVEKDPFFKLGRKLIVERDFKGAVDAFEKSLELNPRAVDAHYELGLLYETRINEPAIALYHYKQVVRLQPNGHQAEIVMARMKGCEQEIAKNVALVQVDPAVMAELERLKEENRRLQRDLETMRALAATSMTVYTNAPPASDAASSSHPVGRGGPIAPQTRSGISPGSGRDTGAAGPGPGAGSVLVPIQRPTPSVLPPRPRGGRAHYVRERETFSSIARQNRISVAALRAANPSINPDRLKVGQAIVVPSK